jgi:TatD DNase family protein
VLHSFDGTTAFAHYALERGCYFGVGGLVTREPNVRLREIVSALPIECLLLETDAPYLAPAGVRDRRNSPVNIPVIAAAVASLRALPIEEVARATTQNARGVFGLPIDAARPVAEYVP